MTWTIDWNVVATAIATLIHKIGEAVDVVLQSVSLSF
jgi:hypothetical protein